MEGAGDRPATTDPGRGRVPPDAPPALSVRMSLFFGTLLISAFTGLVGAHRLLPRLDDGFDPDVWVRLYVNLLVVGTPLALAGGILAAASIWERPLHGSAWWGLVLNVLFLIPAVRLAILLSRQGYFEFVLDTIPTFLEV